MKAAACKRNQRAALGPFDPLKVLRHPETLEAIARGETVPPVTVEIDPTNACNHDCIWCITSGLRARSTATLSRELLLRLPIELAEYGTRSVTFTGGGEPLLHTALPDAMRAAKEAGLQVGLVTNGESLSGAKLEAAVETCTFVRVSLDAGNAETYEQMHRPTAPGAYQRVLSNIGDLVRARGDALPPSRGDVVADAPKPLATPPKRLCRSREGGWRRRAASAFAEDVASAEYSAESAKPTVGAAYLAHPANVGEIGAATRVLAELGADYLQIRPVFMLGLQLSPAMQERMERGIAEAQRLQGERFRVHVIAQRFEQVASGRKPFSMCLGHSLLGVVGADARAYLCCQWRGDPRYVIGDLEQQSFRDVWEGARRREVAARVNVDACPPCRYSTYNCVLESLADSSEKHEAFL